MKKQLEATLLAGFLAGAAQAAPQPNILFIVVDDLNTEVGFMGDPKAITPNMDRLAAQSAVFENAQCQAPICGPSRNSFLTGKYPHNTGLYSLDPMFRNVEELSGVTALPQYFRENGYSSHGVGKIFHTRPDEKSFDKSLGWFGAFGPFPPKPLNLTTNLPVHPYYDWGAFLEDPETADYKVAEAAARLIEKSSESGKPFFIAAGFFRPHCPLYAPQRWFDLHPLEAIPAATDQAKDLTDISPYAHKLIDYKGQQNYTRWLLEENRAAGFRQAYRACVSLTDHCIGMVLEALQKSGLDKNTIVVLFGDQGVQNGRKNLWYKRTLWEATTQVPLLIRTPDQKTGLRVKTPIGLIDIYPTLCELAGLPGPAGLDGLSLAGLMEGRPNAEKRPPALTSHGPGNFSLRDIRWRYIRYADGSEELYDHDADPEERRNLALNPEYAPVIAGFLPFVPKESKPFAPGSKEMASPAFPGM